MKNKRSVGWILLLGLTLSGCNKTGYELMPSGTHETVAPQIYFPPETAATEATETISPEVKEVDYASRYATFYEQLSEADLYTEFSVETTNLEKGTTNRTDYKLGYYADKYAYLQRTKGNSVSVVLSNAKWSYLVDAENKTAQRAEQGTFTYSWRSDFNILFPFAEGAYIETTDDTFEGKQVSVDSYTYNGYTYSFGYNQLNEIVFMKINTGTKEQCFTFTLISKCEDDSLFQLTKDYTISEYTPNE